MHYSMLYCLVLYTRRECVYLWIPGICMFTVTGKKRLLTLPDPLMYGILSSTTGISSIGFLQGQDLFRKKKKKIDIYSHKLQLQSQAGHHKSNVYFKGGKKKKKNLLWFPSNKSLSSVWHALLILLRIATEIFNFSIHPLMWEEQPPDHREVWRRRWSVAALIESPCLPRCWGSTVLGGVRYWCLPLIVESNISERLQQINMRNNVCAFDLRKECISTFFGWT